MKRLTARNIANATWMVWRWMSIIYVLHKTKPSLNNIYKTLSNSQLGIKLKILHQSISIGYIRIMIYNLNEYLCLYLSYLLASCFVPPVPSVCFANREISKFNYSIYMFLNWRQHRKNEFTTSFGNQSENLEILKNDMVWGSHEAHGGILWPEITLRMLSYYLVSLPDAAY